MIAGAAVSIDAASFSLLMLKLKRQLQDRKREGRDAIEVFIRDRILVMQEMAKERNRGEYQSSLKRATNSPYLRRLADQFPEPRYALTSSFLQRLVELCRSWSNDSLSEEEREKLAEYLEKIDSAVLQVVDALLEPQPI